MAIGRARQEVDSPSPSAPRGPSPRPSGGRSVTGRNRPEPRPIKPLFSKSAPHQGQRSTCNTRGPLPGGFAVAVPNRSEALPGAFGTRVTRNHRRKGGRLWFFVRLPAPHGGGSPTHPLRDTPGDTPVDPPHGEAVVFIVHDLVSPCQPEPAHFEPVWTLRVSRVTGFARPVCPVHGINHEDSSGWSVTPTPVRHTCTERGAPVLLTAPAAAVLPGSVPWGGTRSEVLAHRAGGVGGLTTSRTLSTGSPRKAAGMISISFVRAGR